MSSARIRPRLVCSQDMPPAVAERIAAEFEAPPLPTMLLTSSELLQAALSHRPDALLVTSGTRSPPSASASTMSTGPPSATAASC